VDLRIARDRARAHRVRGALVAVLEVILHGSADDAHSGGGHREHHAGAREPERADVPSRPAAESTTASLAPTAAGFVEMPALADVRFRPGLVTVGKTDAATLDVVVRWLKDNPAGQVRIEGHTDDLGAPGANLAVGQKRAASVMSYLVSKGVKAERISIISYGSDRPVCAEKTDGCRAKNRRVHFLVKQR